MTTTRPVPERHLVVGYDGTDTADAALDWALAEAELLDLPVRCVVAVPVLHEPAPLAGFVTQVPDELGRHLAESAQARARSRRPGVPMTTSVLLGGTSGVLVEASRNARLLVVGRGRHRALGEAVAGSTSAQVIAHARCPVVVVEPETARRHAGPVVVGVDGSPSSEAALAYAFETAVARATEVLVVRAWWVDFYAEIIGGAGVDETVVRRVRAAEDVALAETVEVWSAKFPEVAVRSRLVRAHPVEAVLGAAQGAQLVVVGSRGHGGFAGLLLGSVSQGLLHHARPCPLVVVHGR